MSGAFAEATELADVLTIQGELLDSVIAAVYDVQNIVADGQAGRSIKFSVIGSMDPPVADVVAILAEDGDAVQVISVRT